MLFLLSLEAKIDVKSWLIEHAQVLCSNIHTRSLVVQHMLICFADTELQ